MTDKSKYRGRIAPTPTGYLHLGHARTFRIARQRAQEAGGTVIFRNEDLDRDRCKPQYVKAAMDDLLACGLSWHEGPDKPGPCQPYNQSERMEWFLEVWALLRDSGHIYPCNKSRKDVRQALQAPHNDGTEDIFPSSLRPPARSGLSTLDPGNSNWRFRVPDGEKIQFHDGRLGPQSFIAGKDFGDFLVWRRDGFPSYEMAVVADDHAMKISEVVRGEDLLLSTARQLLIYRALRWQPPEFYHCGLLLDSDGQRLAKRHKSLSIREIILAGNSPFEVLIEYEKQSGP